MIPDDQPDLDICEETTAYNVPGGVDFYGRLDFVRDLRLAGANVITSSGTILYTNQREILVVWYRKSKREAYERTHGTQESTQGDTGD